jgi:small subunit ribosomal protein S17
MSEATERNLRKSRTGIVTSNKMDKTAVVAIKQSVKHPLYKKTVKKTKKLKIHDENNELSIGDKVRVEETRPISKEKHWRLVEVIEKAK